MFARIFAPAKTAMQSGKSKTKNWVLEYEATAARRVDPLMGWTSSSDMSSQVRLTFESQEAAIAYAKEKGIPYQVIEQRKSTPVVKSYADNFITNRRKPWTH